MDRRKFITSVGTVGIVAVAGCTGGNGDDGNGGTGGNGDDGNGGNGDDGNGDDEEQTLTHQIGDSFTVGSGSQVIEYTVNSADTYEALGSEFAQEEPDGIFLVVLMELENQSDESFSISSNAYSALDSNDNSFDPDTGAGIYLSTDDRVQEDAISFDQLNPGLSTDGALVFDVPEGEEMRLRVEPTGFLDTSDSHEVELGST